MLTQAACEAQPAAQPAQPNRAWLELIIQAQRKGHGCLPFHLGLDHSDYQTLTHAEPAWREPSHIEQNPLARECSELREELRALRRDEWEELRALLLSGCHAAGADEVLMAGIVATACLGSDHLWRDLGLPSRLHLRELLDYNFPLLTERNVHDMRWKKFFYKQLCEQDGSYICRSPSCDHCPTHHDCFGEEL